MNIPSVPLLLAGVLFTSSSILFIKGSSVPPITLAALRLLTAGAILTPLYFREFRERRDTSRREASRREAPCPAADTPRPSLADIRFSVVPGILLGLHFITWIAGARMTPGSNAALIVNMSPLVMPFLALIAFGERITWREAAGTAISFSGFIILGARDFSLDRGSFTGDIVCFVSMLLFALYLLLARKNNKTGSLWLYIVPLYLIGGFFCLVIALLAETPLPPPTVRDILLVLGMAVLPTVVGHSIYNASMKRLRSQTVTLLTQGEFLFAALLSYLFFGEVPVPVFYLSAALVTAGICVIILRQPKKGPSAP